MCKKEDTMEEYLRETKLLDFSHPDIKELLQNRNWKELSDYEKIGSIYHFVQNEISLHKL